MQAFMWAIPARMFWSQLYMSLGLNPKVSADLSRSWKSPLAFPWRVRGPLAAQLYPLSILASLRAVSTHCSPSLSMTCLAICLAISCFFGVNFSTLASFPYGEPKEPYESSPLQLCALSLAKYSAADISSAAAGVAKAKATRASVIVLISTPVCGQDHSLHRPCSCGASSLFPTEVLRK